jgi:hypothetical protein
MTTQEANQTTLVTEYDQAALAKIQAILKNGNNGHALKLVGADGQEAELPVSIAKALQSLVGYLAKGQAVNVTVADQEISLEEAASFLNVPPFYLNELLEKGDLSAKGVGENRRLELGEVVKYDQKVSKERREALREMTRLSQEWGLYNLPPEAYK